MACGGGNDLHHAVLNWLWTVDVPDMNIVQNMEGQNDAQNEVEIEEYQDVLQNEVQLMEEGQGEAPALEVVDADADTTTNSTSPSHK